MLGARQYAAFTNAIKASTATWKVVVNEVPIQQYYALPYDRWEGYAAERERLLRFLQANVKNVVFLTTDTHANLINEVRFRTLGAAPESSGMWEVVTGPVATNTFAKEIDRFLGQPGSGTAIGALFFKPAASERARDALRRDRHLQLRPGDRHRADAHGRPARRGGDGRCARRPASRVPRSSSRPADLADYPARRRP